MDTQPESDSVIVIVSGLPRSGTSMMMKMLEAGGLPVLTDDIRAADANNPRGYYEYEPVKGLDKGKTGWLPRAKGKAVKVISALLTHLSGEFEYQILFMHRDLDEILASQRAMLDRLGKETEGANEERLAAAYRGHLHTITQWLAKQDFLSVHHVNYNQMLADPTGQARQIQQFLGADLNVEMMADIVDPSLYRSRNA